MRTKLKWKFYFSVIGIIFITGLLFSNQAKGQDSIDKPQISTENASFNTRIIISTSGPVEFSSHQLDDPPRLAIEFHSRNVLSKIDEEVIVNQGVIRRVTSSYYERGRRRSLKSLTFEFTQTVPYKIWQDEDAILLDLQVPKDLAAFPREKMEIFTGSEIDKAIIMKLEAMNTALTQVSEAQIPVATMVSKGIDEEVSKEIGKAEEKVFLPETGPAPISKPVGKTKAVAGTLYWLIGLILVSGAGFFLWHRRKLGRDQRLNRLKSELSKKEKQLIHEEIIRKAMENSSLRREKEYERLKDFFESLKDELIKKVFIKKELITPEQKKEVTVSDLAPDRRKSPRLALTRDFNKTVILRIEAKEKTGRIKTFAGNISCGGLSFETIEDFKVKNPISLRLFFYGTRAPIMKIQAHIAWKRTVQPNSYYGVAFNSLEEKDKSELNSFIESKI